MSIPSYVISQTDADLVFKICAPCAKPEDAEIFIDMNEFTFHSSPYFLRLKLPGTIQDTEGSAHYDEEATCFHIHVNKVNVGEEFDLSLVGFSSEPNLIELSDKVKIETFPVSNDENIVENTFQPRYGFANKYHSMFGQFYCEFTEIIDLLNPDEVKPEDRAALMIADEEKRWNDDHYLADTMETDHILPFTKFQPYWCSVTLPPDKLPVQDSDLINEIIKINPQTGIIGLPDGFDVSICEYQLVDVLLGFCYDHRTTEGDPSAESGWTINKLSSTLSWFHEPSSLKSLLVTFYRRSLCYPLYRNYDLTAVVHQDVIKVLNLGWVEVTKCLVATKRIMDDSEPRYLLNRLYLHDLCVFARGLTNARLADIAQQLAAIQPTKEDLGFSIPTLEVAAIEVLNEERRAAVIDALSTMTLDDGNESDTETESDSETSSDTSSDESSSSSLSD